MQEVTPTHLVPPRVSRHRKHVARLNLPRFPSSSHERELSTDTNYILGQFGDELARLDLGSPASVCLPARPAVMQPSLERQTENVQPLFRKARPAGTAPPKAASDGGEARGHEGHFDASQQQTPPTWESREHKERERGAVTVRRAKEEEEEEEERDVGWEIFPELIIILSPLVVENADHVLARTVVRSHL